WPTSSSFVSFPSSRSFFASSSFCWGDLASLKSDSKTSDTRAVDASLASSVGTATFSPARTALVQRSEAAKKSVRFISICLFEVKGQDGAEEGWRATGIRKKRARRNVLPGSPATG